MKSQEGAIQKITRRLVEYYQPLKVYLFGSTARGEGGPDSDLDFCVVVPDETATAISPWAVPLGLPFGWAGLHTSSNSTAPECMPYATFDSSVYGPSTWRAEVYSKPTMRCFIC